MESCCKVEAIIDKYGLEQSVVGGDPNQYMVARWLGRNEYPGTGLRPLKDWFNRKVLKTVYNEHDRNALETRVESDYEALTSDDDDERLAIVDDLGADGIDGAELADDFVATATLYRHFTNCLDEEKSKGSEGGESESDWEREKIDFLKETIQENAKDSLASLENKGRVPHASKADVSTTVLLRCPACGSQVSFERALERGYVCEDHMTEEDGLGGEASGAEQGSEPRDDRHESPPI